MKATDRRRRQFWLAGAVSALTVAAASPAGFLAAQEQTAAAPTPQFAVSVSWDRTLLESKTTPSLLLILTKHFRPNTPTRKPIYDAIRNLNTKYIRLVPHIASPLMSVAELSPPTATGTSWDFKLVDQQVIPFLEATKGREPILNFSVIPRWMFKTKFDLPVPDDPDALIWNYSNISGIPMTGPIELVDPTGKQVGDYYARLVSWYTKGGFTDENGVYHKSGHKYSIPWWEVKSEMDNGEDIKLYNTIYDAEVAAIRKVSPGTKFIGYSVNCGDGAGHCTPEQFEYFLDPKNHAPGIPIDQVSYHSYTWPAKGTTADHWQYTFFDHADSFLALVQYMEATRRRVRPSTGVSVNEIGCIMQGDIDDLILGFQNLPPTDWKVPEIYWNACGAHDAYLFAGLVRQSIDTVHWSILLGYEQQFRSVSMLYPETGQPNARYRVLELIVNNFKPGDKLVHTDAGYQKELFAQAFVTRAGKKLLLINKLNRAVDLVVKTDAARVSMEVVDPKTGGQKPRKEVVRNGKVNLAPFAVAVVSLP